MRAIKLFLYSIIGIFFSYIIKRDPQKIAFGSWCGEKYIDNSKYLAEYAVKTLKPKGYEIYWVGKKEIYDVIPNDIEFIQINTFRSIFQLLKCKYYFFVQQHNGDICQYNVFNKAVLCFLDHGIGIKKWGADDLNYHGEMDYHLYPLVKKITSKIIGINKTYDYILSTSDPTKINYTSGLRYRMSDKTQFINAGYPRNSIFYSTSEKQVTNIRDKYSNMFSFDKDRRIILYLPTYRRRSNNAFSFLSLSDEQSKRISSLLLRYNAILLEKNHFATQIKNICRNCKTDNIISIDKDIDLQELMLISDIQISDYSGAFLDYILLNRPIINFLYDYEYYRDIDSGLYFSSEEFAAGKITYNFDDTLEELEELLAGNDLYEKQREVIYKRFLQFENPDSMKIILNTVLGIKLYDGGHFDENNNH